MAIRSKKLSEQELRDFIQQGVLSLVTLELQENKEFRVIATTNSGVRLSLMAARGYPRAFRDPRKAFDWAKKLGISRVELNLNTKTWG